MKGYRLWTVDDANTATGYIYFFKDYITVNEASEFLVVNSGDDVEEIYSTDISIDEYFDTIEDKLPDDLALQIIDGIIVNLMKYVDDHSVIKKIIWETLEDLDEFYEKPRYGSLYS